MAAFVKRLEHHPHQPQPQRPHSFPSIEKIDYVNCYTVGAEGVTRGVLVADDGTVRVGWMNHGGAEQYARVYRADPPYLAMNDRGKTVLGVASFDYLDGTDHYVVGRKFENDHGVYVAIYTIHPRVKSFKGRPPDMYMGASAGEPYCILYGTDPIPGGAIALEQIWRLLPGEALRVRFWDGIERELTLESGVPVLKDVVSSVAVPAEKPVESKPNKKKAKSKKGKKAKPLSQDGSGNTKKKVLSGFSQLAGALGDKETVH